MLGIDSPASLGYLYLHQSIFASWTCPCTFFFIKENGINSMVKQNLFCFSPNLQDMLEYLEYPNIMVPAKYWIAIPLWRSPVRTLRGARRAVRALRSPVSTWRETPRTHVSCDFFHPPPCEWRHRYLFFLFIFFCFSFFTHKCCYFFSFPVFPFTFYMPEVFLTTFIWKSY